MHAKWHPAPFSVHNWSQEGYPISARTLKLGCSGRGLRQDSQRLDTNASTITSSGTSSGTSLSSSISISISTSISNSP